MISKIEQEYLTEEDSLPRVIKSLTQPCKENCPAEETVENF